MFLIIKVNVPIDFRLFQGTLKHLQARRIKRNYKGGVGGGVGERRRGGGGGGLPAYEKCRSLWFPD